MWAWSGGPALDIGQGLRLAWRLLPYLLLHFAFLVCVLALGVLPGPLGCGLLRGSLLLEVDFKNWAFAEAFFKKIPLWVNQEEFVYFISTQFLFPILIRSPDFKISVVDVSLSIFSMERSPFEYRRMDVCLNRRLNSDFENSKCGR